jgi:hypothetical protein
MQKSNIWSNLVIRAEHLTYFKSNRSDSVYYTSHRNLDLNINLQISTNSEFDPRYTVNVELFFALLPPYYAFDKAHEYRQIFCTIHLLK